MILPATGVMAFVLFVYNFVRSAINPHYRSGMLYASLLSATVYLGILKLLQLMLGIVSGSSVFGIRLPIVVAVIVDYAILTRAVMNHLARLEGCENPRQRFTGKGSSLGYRFSNLFLAIMTGAGAYGLNRAGLVVADRWLLIAFACSAVLMWASRYIDSHHYDVGNGSSIAPITKRYHDFMVQGVFWGLSGVTWIAYSIHSLLTLSVADWSAMIVIAGGLVALLVIGIAGHFHPIDYAKIHPCLAKDDEEEVWDGYAIHWIVGIALVIGVMAVIAVAFYWLDGQLLL